MEYEFDADMEESYKLSFLKSFKRQIDDCLYNFFIVDAVFDGAQYLDEFWSYAKSKGFQVGLICLSQISYGRHETTQTCIYKFAIDYRYQILCQVYSRMSIY